MDGGTNIVQDHKFPKLLKILNFLISEFLIFSVMEMFLVDSLESPDLRVSTITMLNGPDELMSGNYSRFLGLDRFISFLTTIYFIIPLFPPDPDSFLYLLYSETTRRLL